MESVLVTGASGFLGAYVCREMARTCRVVGTYSRNLPIAVDGMLPVKLDVTDYRDLKRVLGDARPVAVIHCAAISDTGACQRYPLESAQINVQATINLAGLCADRDIRFVFTSSDLVFDGANAPYTETDAVCPISEYGEQKVYAELGIADVNNTAVVCRMPPMFGVPEGRASSFSEVFFAALLRDGAVPLFTDEFRTPVSVVDAAVGLRVAIASAERTLHLGGAERIARYDFGRLLCEHFDLPTTRLKACRQSDVTLSVSRPPDVSLNSERAATFGWRARALAEACDDLAPSRACLAAKLCSPQ